MALWAGGLGSRAAAAAFGSFVYVSACLRVYVSTLLRRGLFFLTDG